MPSVTSEFLFVVWFAYLWVDIYIVLGCDPVVQSHDNKEGSQGRGLKDASLYYAV